MTSKPYVPAETDLPEFTAKALILGIIMAVVLGTANAKLGPKAWALVGIPLKRSEGEGTA